MSKRPTDKVAFMISCTPLKKKKSDLNEEDDNNEGKTVLVLAPFQPQPKLVFSNIRVGVTASREIVAENPLQKNIEIEFEFLESEKISSNDIGKWSMDQTRLKLPAGGSQSVLITWCPTQAGNYHVNVCVKQLLGKNGQSTRKISQISISATSFAVKQIKENKRTVKPLRDRNVVTTTKKSSNVVTKQDNLKTPQKMNCSIENVSRTFTKSKSNITFDTSELMQTSKNLFPSSDYNSLHLESEIISIKIEKSEDQLIMQNETNVLPNVTGILCNDTRVLGIDSQVLHSNLTDTESMVITEQVIKTEQCDWENDSLDDNCLSDSFKLSSFSSFEKQLNDFNFRSTLDGTANCIPMPPFPLINQNDIRRSTQNYSNSRGNLSPLIKTEKTRNDTYTVADQEIRDINQFISSEFEKQVSSVPSSDKRVEVSHTISTSRHFKGIDNITFQEYNLPTDLIAQSNIKIITENVSLADKEYYTSNVKSSVTEVQTSSPKVNIQAELPQRSYELWRISPPKRMKIVNVEEESPDVLPPHALLKNQKKRPTFKAGKLPKARLTLKRRSPRSNKEISYDKTSPNLKKNNLIKQLLTSEASSTITVSEEFMSSTDTYQLKENYSKNPFCESFIAFIDVRFVDETEKQLLKWVNIMLSPPLELEAVSLMPTERQILNFSKACIGTSTAHTVQLAKQYKLDFVRKAGRTLLMSSDVASVLKKVDVAIENGLIAIRQDRNLHQDIGLQEIVLKLLLCYHPLWLRIALETIYDQSISLNSNSDIGGIVNFIRKHVLSDNYLRKKHAHPTVPFLMRPDFEDRMKKFILKKFLTLIYFLDVAKRKKLIRHDPCLFCVNSPFKMTTAILLEFNKEFIKGGDNSKYLSTFGFKLLHKQTYLEEIDLKLKNRNDLRDGIRLTRLVEIIIKCEKGKFYNQLKAPALSRFQKIHNVKVALKAYKEAGFVIENNVTEVDIINGHREKILSFLWQLRGVTLNAAVFSIQMFWRKHKDMIKQRKTFLKTKEAICKIQRWYRIILAKKSHFSCSEPETYRVNAVMVLNQRKEETALAKKQRAQFLTLKSAAVTLQRKWRALLAMRKCRVEFLKLKKAVKLIECHREAVVIARLHKDNYLLLKSVVIYAQRKWRAILAMRKCRNEYLRLKLAVTFVESEREATIMARKQRTRFLMVKAATINVQRRWRAILFMRQVRISLANKKYLIQLKSAVSFVEMKRKSILLQRKHPALPSNERADFLSLKMSVIIVQRKWRALLSMRKYRTEYLQLKFAVATIESLRKAVILAKRERENFFALKSAVLTIQRKWRATLAMQECRRSYMKLKWTVSFIESKRAALICAQKKRAEYINLKNTAIKIQRRWKAILYARQIRNIFLKLKWAVRYVEAKRSVTIAGRRDRIEFIALRGATTAIQKRWRALLEMRKCRKYYLELKKAVSLIEAKRIGTITTRKAQSEFIAIKSATIFLQRKWRARILMKQCRHHYLKLKETVSFVESKRIAVITSRKSQMEFQSLKTAAIVLQRRRKAILAMRECRRSYLRLKWAISLVKSRRLAVITARKDRISFLRLKSASIKIQRKWRAIIAMRKVRSKYLQLKWAVTLLKSKRVATVTARKERVKFTAFKQAVVVIQRRWRTILFMKKIRSSLKQKHYMMHLKLAVRFVELKRKATIISRKERTEFLTLKAAVLTVQREWRAKLFKRKLRSKIIEQRQINFRRNKAAIKIQMFFRNQIIHRRFEKERLNNAATTIQAFWRGCHLRRKSTIVFEKNFKPLAPGKTLGEMRIGLIDKLRKTNTIQKIVHYLQILDTITTFSSHLAYDLVQDGMIEIIYTFLASFNRNVSDQQARLHAYKVLVNLTKIDITSEIVWMVTSKFNGCDIILSDCLHYCKSNENIFCACVTLLWLWSFRPEKVKIIINHPKYKFIVAKINKEFSSVVKGKCNSNSGKTLLPSRVPNWGIDNKKNGLRLFIDSRFAWKVISESLKK